MRKNTQLRVLHVVSTRPIGGVGSFLKNMSDFINMKAFEFSFIFSSGILKGEFEDHMKDLGMNTYILPDFYTKPLSYVRETFSFYKKYHKNFDIIHVHSPNIGSLHLALAKHYDISVRICHSHSTKGSDKMISSIINFFLNKVSILFSTNFMACSLDAGEFLFGKTRSFDVINNSIDLEKFLFNKTTRYHYRNKLGFKESDIILGHIGYFQPVKNQSFLINVLNSLNNSKELLKNKYKLILVGEGPEINNVKKEVQKFNLESQVFFLGQRTDVANLLSSFDLLVMPSLFEGFPLSLIEAQASNLPCIVSDSISTTVNVNGRVKFINISNLRAVDFWVTAIENTKVEDRNSLVATTMTNFNSSTQINNLQALYSKYFIDVNEKE